MYIEGCDFRVIHIVVTSLISSFKNFIFWRGMMNIKEKYERKNSVTFEILLLIFNIILALMKSIFRFFIPPLQKSIKGDVVLITGAGHGLGRELAYEFARHGAHVVCLDIDEGSNKAVILTLHVMGYEAKGYKINVGDPTEVDTLAKEVKSRFGKVSILVNNAGIMPVGELTDISKEEILDAFKVNILSHFWVLQAFLPDMIQQRKGHVVAISSMCGVSGVGEMATYCSTKFAIRGLMEAATEEMRMMGLENHIHFTTVFPFYVDTGLAPDPQYRFPWLFAPESASTAAKKIVVAVRQNRTELSIPAPVLASTNLIRLFPKEVICLIMDFLSGNKKRKRDCYFDQ